MNYSFGSSYDDAKKMINQSDAKYPEFPDYYMPMGLISWRNDNRDEAIDLLEKCIYYGNNYSGKTESLALGQIDQVYGKLLTAYIVADNKPKIVEITVALLKTKKYDYENLVVLIKTLLTQEKEKDIILFLSKLYDYNKFKDKIYLLKSCESSENEILINYYKQLMSEEELNAYNS